MNRIFPVEVENAEGKVKEVLDKIKVKSGRVANIFKTMAHAPAMVEMYLGMNRALTDCSLPLRVRELIALAVAEDNQCDYCVAAHAAMAKHAGLTQEEIHAARNARANDPKENGVLQLAKKLSANRGNISDLELSEAKKAGLTDQEIIEVIGVVSFNLFTNYFNHVANPAIDFPKPEPLKE